MDPEGQFYSPYVGMSNNPVSGTDPNGGWVKGAGLFTNLFKSDSRIHAERYASSWSSSTAEYYATKVGSEWGVYSYDKAWIGTGSTDFDKFITFTPVGSDGSLGAMDGGFVSSYTNLPPGNIDFDPGTQLSLGLFAAGGFSLAGSSAGGSAVQYTKSNLRLGQQMHKSYKVGADGIKEFRLPSGKRIDFLDIRNSTIFELKPFNPRAMRAGQNQLRMYKQELQTMQQFKGVNWKTVLDTY
jgi:hypothetical protein